MRLTMLSLMLFAFVSCQLAVTQMTDSQKAELVDRVTLAVEAYWDTWSQLNVDSALTHFHGTPETGFAWEGQTALGLETLREEWKRAFSGFASQTVTIADRQVTVLAPDVVHVMESGTYSLTAASGTSTPEFRFSQTTVWVHRNKAWKILLGHVATATP